MIGGSVESAGYLLDCRADINALPSGFDGRATPLHWAAAGKVTLMVELLVGLGADMSATDSRFGATPLAWAEHSKHHEIVELLKKQGAL